MTKFITFPAKYAFPAKYTLFVLFTFIVSTSCGQSRPPKNNTVTKIDQALMQASHDGDVSKLRALLLHGANINAKDESGENALVWAANGGQLNSINFLLGQGISVKDQNGRDALFAAVDEGQTSIVNSLLLHGADVNARDKAREGATPLMIACFYDTGGEGATQYPDIVRLLLQHRANVRAKDDNGKTALMYLRSMPNAKIHKMLLDAGAKK